MRLFNLRFCGALLVIVALFAGVELWNDFQEKRQQQRTKAALWDPDASSIERVRALEACVAEGRAAVPRLVQALQNKDPSVREAAAIGLYRLGPDTREALPQIIRSLEDDSRLVRESLAGLLGKFPFAAEQVAPHLVDRLRDQDSGVQAAAAEALVRLGTKTLPTVARAADDESTDARRRVAEILTAIGSAESAPVVATLRDLSQDQDASVRTEAVAGLMMLEVLTVDDVLRVLRDDSSDIVSMLLSGYLPNGQLNPKTGWQGAPPIISRFAAESEQIVPELVRLLDDQQRRGLRYLLLENLAALGPPAQEAIPRIIEILEDPGEADDLHVREMAMQALARISTDRNQVVSRLTRLLRETGLSRAAGRSLREFDPQAARDVVPELIERLRSHDPEVRWTAAWAIAGIGPEAKQAIPELVEALQEHGTLFWPIIQALRQMGAEAAPVVPLLMESIDERRQRGAPSDELTFVIEPLGDIGPGAEKAVPLLAEIVRSDGESERRQAVNALRKIGVASDEVLGVLSEAALHDPSASVRMLAIRALVELAPGKRNVLSCVVDALDDRSPDVRMVAAWALAERGAKARFALPALRKALQDESNSHLTGRPRIYPHVDSFEDWPHQSVRDVVAYAIERIEASPSKNAVVD